MFLRKNFLIAVCSLDLLLLVQGQINKFAFCINVCRGVIFICVTKYSESVVSVYTVTNKVRAKQLKTFLKTVLVLVLVLVYSN